MASTARCQRDALHLDAHRQRDRQTTDGCQHQDVRTQRALKRMERRDFLIRTGSATALAAVTGTTGFLFHNREPQKYRNVLVKTANFEVSPDPTFPVLTSATNPDPVAALNAAMDGIGGRRFLQRSPTEPPSFRNQRGW